MRGRKRPSQLVLTLKQHFAVVAFCGVALLLLAALALLKHTYIGAVVLAVFLCLLCAAYYLGYTYNYKKILNHSPRHEYLYKIFSTWGVLAFGALWLFLFALAGELFDRRFERLFFNGAGFFPVFKQLIYLCGDFFLLGIPKAILPALGEGIQKGPAGEAFLAISSSVFKVSLLAAVAATWNERREARRAAQRVFQLLDNKEKTASSYQKRLVAELAKQYAVTPHIPEEIGERIVAHLRGVKSKEGCDLAFLIAQSTGSEPIFTAAVDYLISANDRRVRQLDKHVTDTALSRLLQQRIAPIRQKRPT